MAIIQDPRKFFQFSIILEGLNPFLCQEVEVPEVEVEKAEHGDTNYDVKTAGRTKYGTLRLKKLRVASASDNLFFNWMKQCSNVWSGGGDTPILYKKNLYVDELGLDGSTILNSEFYENVWPSRRGAMNFQRMTSDNLIEEIEMEVDRVDRV